MEDKLNEVIKKAKPNMDKIKDVDKFVNEVKGYKCNLLVFIITWSIIGAISISLFIWLLFNLETLF